MAYYRRRKVYRRRKGAKRYARTSTRKTVRGSDQFYYNNPMKLLELKRYTKPTMAKAASLAQQNFRKPTGNVNWRSFGRSVVGGIGRNIRAAGHFFSRYFPGLDDLGDMVNDELQDVGRRISDDPIMSTGKSGNAILSFLDGIDRPGSVNKYTDAAGKIMLKLSNSKNFGKLVNQAGSVTSDFMKGFGNSPSSGDLTDRLVRMMAEYTHRNTRGYTDDVIAKAKSQYEAYRSRVARSRDWNLSDLMMEAFGPGKPSGKSVSVPADLRDRYFNVDDLPSMIAELRGYSARSRVPLSIRSEEPWSAQKDRDWLNSLSASDRHLYLEKVSDLADRMHNVDGPSNVRAFLRSIGEQSSVGERIRENLLPVIDDPISSRLPKRNKPPLRIPGSKYIYDPADHVTPIKKTPKKSKKVPVEKPKKFIFDPEEYYK